MFCNWLDELVLNVFWEELRMEKVTKLEGKWDGTLGKNLQAIRHFYLKKYLVWFKPIQIFYASIAYKHIRLKTKVPCFS